MCHENAKIFRYMFSSIRKPQTIRIIIGQTGSMRRERGGTGSIGGAWGQSRDCLRGKRKHCGIVCVRSVCARVAFCVILLAPYQYFPPQQLLDALSLFLGIPPCWNFIRLCSCTHPNQNQSSKLCQRHNGSKVLSGLTCSTSFEILVKLRLQDLDQTLVSNSKPSFKILTKLQF